MGFFHHIGTFLLLAATVLLIVTSISAPVVHDISLLKIQLGTGRARDYTHVAFGTFGACVNHADAPDDCTNARVGYSPADVLDSAGASSDFSDTARSTTRALTRAMILHPIAGGINFIAFLLSLGAGVIGSLLASMVALLAFIVTVAIMIIDFVLFSIVRSNINDNTDYHATFGVAAWTTLAAAICSLLATVVVFLTCCSGRRKRRHQSAAAAKTEYVETPRRRRGWFPSRRY